MCLNKRKITYSDDFGEKVVEVPCGRCIECLMQKSTDIVVRGVVEYKKWNNYYNGCFITLTYKNKCLPENGSLKKQDYIVFLRELRRLIKKEEGRTGIRILGCGEYGTLKGRPHYHLVIFNWLPNDLKIDNSCNSKTKNILYKSKILSELWGKGRVVIGKASENTVGYVAGYTTKKGFKLNVLRKEVKYENSFKTMNSLIFKIDKDSGIITRKPKSIGVKMPYFKRVKNTFNLVKEYEFIALPKGVMGGLGSCDEDLMIKMVRDCTISLNNGNKVSVYSIPYYYIKKIKQILKKREMCRDFLISYNTNELNNLNCININLDRKEIDEILIKNRNFIINIKNALMEWEKYCADSFFKTKELAQKNGKTLKEWKDYQAKIRLRKTYNRLKNLKRDYEELKPGEMVNNQKAWFFENEIGKELVKEEGLAVDVVKDSLVTFFDVMLD